MPITSALRKFSTLKIFETKTYSICGNRLIMLRCEMTDQELLQASEISSLCWENGHRIADGVACFAEREDYIRYCFFNPDGSFEKVCGNGVFAAGAMLKDMPNRSLQIRPFDYPELIFVSNSEGYTIINTVNTIIPLSSIPQYPTVRIHNTGTPHFVLNVKNVHAVDLSKFGQEITQQKDVNVTIFSIENQTLLARTYERGVYAETDACGTGAMAVALESYLSGFKKELIHYPGGIYSIRIENIPTSTYVKVHLQLQKTDVQVLA